MAFKQEDEIRWVQNGEVGAGTDTSTVPDGNLNEPIKDVWDNTLDNSNRLDTVETDVANLQTGVANDRFLNSVTGSANGSMEFAIQNGTNVNFNSVHNHNDLYYTQSQLNTSGQSIVHWDNIQNEPTFSVDGHTHDDLYVKVFENTVTEQYSDRYLYGLNFPDFLRVNVAGGIWGGNISPITITVRMELDYGNSLDPEVIRGLAASEVSWRIIPQAFTTDGRVTWTPTVVANEIYRVDNNIGNSIGTSPEINIGTMTSLEDNSGFTLFLNRTGGSGSASCNNFGDFGQRVTILVQYDSEHYASVTPLSPTSPCP